MTTRLRALPPWFWLAVIVTGSALLRIVLARRMVAPWIMVDELIYSELAKSFALHGQFLVRDVASNGYGFVYPVLIAPAFRLFSSVPQAYTAAKDIDSVLMSLTAVPAYLLARRIVRQAEDHRIGAVALDRTRDQVAHDVTRMPRQAVPGCGPPRVARVARGGHHMSLGDLFAGSTGRWGRGWRRVAESMLVVSAMDRPVPLTA